MVILKPFDKYNEARMKQEKNNKFSTKQINIVDNSKF